MRRPQKQASVPDLASDRDRALSLTNVSRETLARLDRFVDLVLRWQKTTNLVAASTLPEIWTRHIADSLQLLPLVPDAKIWVDLGAGAGFPGVVLACALAEAPDARVHLVESNQKKAAFLREALRITGAPGIVHPVRIEDFVERFAETPSVVTARALAPLPELLGMAFPLLKKGAKGLFLKGQDVEAELTAAAKYWSIEASLAPSKTSRQGHIVLVCRIEPQGEPASRGSG
jgi:16S rRNA (guanine527-N7)-methyltransferase